MAFYQIPVIPKAEITLARYCFVSFNLLRGACNLPLLAAHSKLLRLGGSEFKSIQPLKIGNFMHAQFIPIVQKSWQSVAAIAPTAAKLFYSNLFSLDPSLQWLFKGDMTVQGERLMHMIGMAVAKLDDLQSLIPTLQNLGKRHSGYGVLDAHYATVGEALLTTLQTGLGEAFTPTVEHAWSSVYGLIASVMISASTAAEVEAVDRYESPSMA